MRNAQDKMENMTQLFFFSFILGWFFFETFKKHNSKNQICIELIFDLNRMI